MFNSVTNNLSGRSRRNSDPDGGWDVDRNPGVRLFCLFLLLLLPLGAVFGRLAYLQAYLADGIATLPEETITTYERIPSRDGRILASDGTVLAQDVELFEVQMHYRWLEEPADAQWLRQMALSRLNRAESKDREKVDSVQASVLKTRAEMWDRLSLLTDVESEQLTQERSRIQKRIEHMVESVEQRRAERLAATEQTEEPAAQDAGKIKTVWNTIVKELTTPPPRKRLDPIKLREETEYYRLVENVSYEVAAEIETHPERYPGLRIEATTRRVYPEHSFAPHVIGARLSIGEEQLRRRSEQFAVGDPLGYRDRDRIGKSGLERSYDRHLRGLPGMRRVIKNRRGEILKTEIARQPHIGRDLKLALHSPLQKRVETLLDERIGTKSTIGKDDSQGKASAGACAIVMNVHNGEVLATVSAPRFDQNLLIHPDPVEWRRILQDPRRPFFHRATEMTIAPGSVFKTLTAVALLESGLINPDKRVFCQGYLDTPDKFRCYTYRHYGTGHGETNLSGALCRSCNVYFYTAARRLGPEPIVKWARKFGFGQPTGIDLPGERSGNLPTPPAMRPIQLVSSDERRRPAPWYGGDTLGLSIGQSRLSVTPMQIVRMMSAVANGGLLVTPHVVDNSGPALIGKDDLARGENRDPVRIGDLSEATLKRVREGLKRVVHHPRGTGYKRVRLKEITIAGKTGTAEVGGGKDDHAWFAGYVPAENPRYAFVVVLEHAGSGGQEAGPVAKELVELMLELGLVEGDGETERIGDGE